jgi:hypothetical protein
MIPRRLKFGALALACTLLTIACSSFEESTTMNHDGLRASRLPPAKVEPVTLGGIRYAQRAGKESADGQVGGLLSAYDAQGQILWTIKIYDNRRKPELEGDVQDVFFSSMSVDADGRLRIVNERGDTFLVDVKTRNVTAIASSKSADDEDALVPPPRS